VTSLGPGCSQPGTPVLAIDAFGDGSALELRIDSQHPNSFGGLFASIPSPADPISLESCLIYIDPSQIVAMQPIQMDANGDFVVTVVMPDVPQLLGMSFVLQSALLFAGAPINGVSASNALLVTLGCPEGTAMQGCSPAFWSNEENFDDWPAQFTPNTLFSSVFENAFPGLTLHDVLELTGTGLNALGIQVVAALLNAATINDFALTTDQVISMFNAVFPGGNFNELREQLFILNSGQCPLGVPTPTGGCDIEFWSQEENEDEWPAQFSPTTLFSSVFENAFPGLTLEQVLEQSGTGLNALGREVVAALLNAATLDDYALTTAEVISMFNAVFPGGNLNELRETLAELNAGDCPLGAPSTSEGCSPGFWKQEHHGSSWPAQYSPDTLFSSVFDDAFPGLTLDEVLEQGGGGLNALGRQVVAALLNAATIDDFPLTTAQVISMFNAVFPNGDFEELKDTLEDLNSGNCPFDDPEVEEGCDIEFWSQEENEDEWPAQFAPNTLFSSVFENAFPGLTLEQVLEQGGTGLNALGREVVAALLNAATLDDYPLTTAQVISTFNAVFPGGNIEELREMLDEFNSGDCPLDDPPAGCDIEFWSLEENEDEWPTQFAPNALFSSVFENAFPGLTLEQVLEQTGTGLNALGRQVVAALLNAATLDDYPLTTAEVISMFNAVFPGGNFDELREMLAELNSGDCPLDDPAASQGCGPGFWKNEQHASSWPAQYSPTTQFSSVFENAFPGLTLDEVLEQSGGGLNAIGRHLVAVLLNAATIEDFPLTTAQVISMFNAVFPNGDFEELQETLDELTSGHCPF
jgi:hypothetical protein